MPVVGAALLGAVRLADAAVQVEHGGALRSAQMHPVDPGAGQIGQGGEAGFAGRPPGPETAHLAGRGGGTVDAIAIDHGAHRRIMSETIGVVDILIPGEAAEH